MREGPGQAALEQGLAEVEAFLRTFPTGAVGDGNPKSTDPMSLDITQGYRDELATELVTAMVSHGGALGVAGDRWLSVAARDGRVRVDSRIMGQPVLSLRVGGRDLAALREGTLSAAEARERVQRTNRDQ